jgi:hypothetical protein
MKTQNIGQSFEEYIKSVRNGLFTQQVSISESITDARYRQAKGEEIYELLQKQAETVIKVRAIDEFMGSFGDQIKEMEFKQVRS